MISCRDAAELIPLHVGDDLPGEEAARLEDHLDGCALCSAEYDSFAAAREAILSLRDEMPQRGGLWEEVASNLGADGSAALRRAAPSGGEASRRPSRWVAWTGLAAAAALAVAFLPPFLRPGADPAASGSADGGLSADAPLIQATSDAELREFLLRSAALSMPLLTPAADEAGQLPLATPVAAPIERKVY